MRKEYIIPTTEIISVETEQMIAQSLTFDSDNAAGTAGIFDNEYATGAAGSKGNDFDLWEDEE